MTETERKKDKKKDRATWEGVGREEVDADVSVSIR